VYGAASTPKNVKRSFAKKLSRHRIIDLDQCVKRCGSWEATNPGTTLKKRGKSSFFHGVASIRRAESLGELHQRGNGGCLKNNYLYQYVIKIISPICIVHSMAKVKHMKRLT
jgi:hypothetical protein